MKRPTSGKATARAIFSLLNLHCSMCSVEPELRKLDGVNTAKVDYVTDTVLVDYNPKQVSNDDIRHFLKNLREEA